jgi:putative methionine-R-sulfoxide reductase with GAF domain
MKRATAKRPRQRKLATKRSVSRVVARTQRTQAKRDIHRHRTLGGSCRLSKNRAKFFRSGSLLVDVLYGKGLVSLKTARALHRSLEKGVARKPEGFSLAFSANLCKRVSKLIANNSPSGRDKRHKEMDSLEAISRIVSSTAGDQRVLEKCLTLLRELVPFQNGAIFILKEGTGKLELEATLGYPQDLIERVQFDLGQGLSAWAAREKRSVLVRELTRPEKEGIPRLGSFLAVPIIAGTRSVGVITMGHPQSGAFISDHKRILQLFCTLISGSVLSLMAERQREAVAVV